MARIKGVGVPTRKTKGGIGDIYTDTTTDKEYKCTGSYGSANYETEYDWRAVTVFGKNSPNPVVVTPEVKAETKVEAEVEEAPVEETAEEVVTEVADEVPVEEAPVEEKKPKQNKGKQRTNYAAAYNK